MNHTVTNTLLIFLVALLLPLPGGAKGQSKKFTRYMETLRDINSELDKFIVSADAANNVLDNFEISTDYTTIAKLRSLDLSDIYIADFSSSDIYSYCDECIKYAHFEKIDDCTSRTEAIDKWNQSITNHLATAQSASQLNNKLDNTLARLSRAKQFTRKHRDKVRAIAGTFQYQTYNNPVYGYAMDAWTKFESAYRNVTNMHRWLSQKSKRLDKVVYELNRQSQIYEALAQGYISSMDMSDCDNTNISDGLWSGDLEEKTEKRTIAKLFNEISAELKEDIRIEIEPMTKGDAASWLSAIEKEDRLKPFESIVQKIIKLESEIKKDSLKMKSLHHKARDLEKEMEQVLDEIRNGEFCSECNRSKSEIEDQTSMRFLEHVDHVGGVVVHMSEEDIQEKEDTYLKKIQDIHDDIAKIEETIAEKFDKIDQLKQAFPDAYDEWLEEIGSIKEQMNNRLNDEREAEQHQLEDLEKRREDAQWKLIDLRKIDFQQLSIKDKAAYRSKEKSLKNHITQLDIAISDTQKIIEHNETLRKKLLGIMNRQFRSEENSINIMCIKVSCNSSDFQIKPIY